MMKYMLLLDSNLIKLYHKILHFKKLNLLKDKLLLDLILNFILHTLMAKQSIYMSLEFIKSKITHFLF